MSAGFEAGSGYAINPVPGCSARFANASAAADTSGVGARTASVDKAVLSNAMTKAGAAVARATAAPLTSLLDYLIGPGG